MPFDEWHGWDDADDDRFQTEGDPPVKYTSRRPDDPDAVVCFCEGYEHNHGCPNGQ